jgi:hypothetical protein
MKKNEIHIFGNGLQILFVFKWEFRTALPYLSGFSFCLVTGGLLHFQKPLTTTL